jgi:hypothetical protein
MRHCIYSIFLQPLHFYSIRLQSTKVPGFHAFLCPLIFHLATVQKIHDIPSHTFHGRGCIATSQVRFEL